MLLLTWTISYPHVGKLRTSASSSTMWTYFSVKLGRHHWIHANWDNNHAPVTARASRLQLFFCPTGSETVTQTALLPFMHEESIWVLSTTRAIRDDDVKKNERKKKGKKNLRIPHAFTVRVTWSYQPPSPPPHLRLLLILSLFFPLPHPKVDNECIPTP